MDDLDDIPESIKKMLTLPPMDIPEFRPHIKAEDLDDEFHERDKRILLTMSVIEQKLDVVLMRQKLLTDHARKMEANQIITNKKQSQINFFHNGLKWVSVTVVAGAVAAVFRTLFEWIKR